MRAHEYATADATDLAALVRSGQVTPSELVTHAIAGMDETEPQIHAFVHRLDEQAQALAKGVLPDGPFQGVPMAVKDFDGLVAGQPFTASCRFLDGFVADHDSAAIGRLKQAGFVFVGRTNLPELALLGTTEPAWRGPSRNPWNVAHSTGGSSGGSAAAVAARVVPVAHGGDGGGSLRIPASANGLVGLKPTRGRVSMAPDFGEGWGGYVQWGTLTRTVRDTAALLDVMSGPEAGDPYAAPLPSGPFLDEVRRAPGRLRIAFSTASLYGKATDPACAQVVTDTARLLESLGHDVVEAAPTLDRDALIRAYLVQVGVGTAAEIGQFSRMLGRTPRSSDFEPATWFLHQVGSILTGVELSDARETTHAAGRVMADFHRKYDIFVTPTLAYPPAKIGELALKPSESFGLAALRVLPIKSVLRLTLDQLAATALERTPNTQIFNQTGQPAISLPLGMCGDLPAGVQFAAGFGNDSLLLRLASQLEEAAPWRGRRSVVSYGAAEA